VIEAAEAFPEKLFPSMPRGRYRSAAKLIPQIKVNRASEATSKAFKRKRKKGRNSVT
jgi:hypothetical protein